MTCTITLTRCVSEFDLLVHLFGSFIKQNQKGKPPFQSRLSKNTKTVSKAAKMVKPPYNREELHSYQRIICNSMSEQVRHSL